ncbi:MAG: hypothetical protein ACR2FO_05070 [Actinomycetota bacterium]
MNEKRTRKGSQQEDSGVRRSSAEEQPREGHGERLNPIGAMEPQELKAIFAPSEMF